MHRRLALLSAVLAAGVLAPPAIAHHRAGHTAGPGSCDPTKTPLACGEDATTGYELEVRAADNFHHGHMLEVDYSTAERLPGQVVSGHGWGDSGLWTGVYLGGQSFRYAVAKENLHGKKHKGLTDEQIAFWTAQRDDALARITRMVSQYHLLVNIGREWKSQLAPDASGDPITFGGGVFQGEEGMLMRACSPAYDKDTNPIGIKPGSNKRIFGPFRWEDGVDYYCETAPSRDTYAGTTYGLLLAYDLVASDVAGMRDLIRSDVLTLADRLVKYGWTYPRPHGNVSIPEVPHTITVPDQVPLPEGAPRTVTIPGGDGHSFDNFISPEFMVQVPLARLNIAQIAKHVASTGGTSAEQAKWNAVWAEETASQLPILGTSMQFDAADPNDGYYKYNLHHLTAFTTIRLEQDPAIRQALMQAIGIMDKTTGDDVNAHFESITYGLTGEPARLAGAVTHLEEWLAHRANIYVAPVKNSTRCTQYGGSLECVPQDQREADGVVVPSPGATAGQSVKLRARNPLPVALRPPTDFLWQRPPTQLDDGDQPWVRTVQQTPMIDYLTPYWTIRYFTEVAAPDLTPFPAWPGPSHH